MKKTWLIIIGTVILSLAACSTTNEKEDQDQTKDPEIQTNTTETDQEQSDKTEKIDQEQPDSDKPAQNEINTEVTNKDEAIIDDNFEESATIKANIDLTDMEAKIETDNPNTRVIFFSTTDYTKKYKTIFVKRENRLKIINLKDDGLIYNEILN